MPFAIIAFAGCNLTGRVQPAHDGLFPVHPSCVHVVPRPGFEPGASCSVDKRAIQLRYRGNVHMMVPMRLTFPPPQPDSTGKGRFQDTSRRVRMPGSSPHGSSCEKWWRIDLNNCGLLNLTNGFTVRRIRPLCHATIIGNLHHPATRRMSHLNLSALRSWMLFEKPSSMFTLQPFRMCIGFRLTIMISVPIALRSCMHP